MTTTPFSPAGAPKDAAATHSLSAFLTLLALSLGVWLAAVVLCLLVGSTSLGLPTGPDGSILRAVLANRAESVAMASLVGAALAAAGVVYQSVLRNPLADPYLLGVASGATLGSMLWRFPVWTALPLPWLAAAGQQTAALLGALASVATVFACSARRGRLEPVTLLLTGVIVSSVCAALLLLLVSLRPELLASSGGATSVLVGGLQTNLTTAQQLSALAVVAVGLILLLLLSSAMSVAMLSDAEAESIGVRVTRLRWTALIVASVMVAAAVAVSGPIGFVGLICPHLARRLVGPDPRRLLPVATALGAALLASADALCRLLSQQQYLATVLPVGTLTALLGGPFFLLLLTRSRPQT